jgi:hypothetical protein
MTTIPEQGNRDLRRYTDIAIKACLLLLAFAAPLSIAATQTAWALAIFFWLIRLVFVRPRFKRPDMLELALLAFLGLTVLSSICSYVPDISIRKLVPVSLVTIAYLVAQQAKDVKFRRKALAVLLIGAFVSVVGTLAFLAIGQNLKVVAMTPENPLRTVGVIEGDTLWRIDGHGINSPADLKAVEERHPNGAVVEMTFYRHELVMTGDLVVPPAAQRGEGLGLGVTEWQRGRDTRASGFYGHYVTYAEMLQLVMSLALGLLLTVPGGWFTRERVLLGVAVAGYGLAMFLTITRASWAGLLVSAGIMVLVGTSRKTILICLALAIPLAIGGLIYLQQKRNVSLVDSTDGSTQWRLIVWREGWGVLTSNPRHLAVGVGMDSIKTKWPDWHMFGNGTMPLGHLHSDYLEIAFERGVPALIAWIAWLAIYLVMLWRGFRGGNFAWPERGILLGAFGGTIGFLSSGLVHYNWGDSEDAMIFYLIMGLALGTLRGQQTPVE